MIDEIKRRLQRAVEERVFPGAVVGLISGGERQFVPAGRFTYDLRSPTVTAETVYDVASITKSIPVALTALTFIERDELKLDDQIIKYLPEIDIKDAEKGLIRHLLTYTYVLQKNPDPNFTYANFKAADVFDFLFHREFEFLPGTKQKYSNTPFNLLGLILERISGEKLYSLCAKMILNPLRMRHSTFQPADKKSIPPTEIIDWRGEIQGEVHDETAFILQREGYDAGCAGLFSNADDLLNGAEMLLSNGTFRNERVFKEETITLMTTNALPNINGRAGIGWELNEPKFMGRYAHPHMIGKTGYTGTFLAIDPLRKKAMILLSNRTYPRRNDNGAVNRVRSDISDIVFGTA